MERLQLQAELTKAVKDLGYTEWTEIQKKAIPLIQAGKDVIGQSATGSGKTAAFGLPILEKVQHKAGIQVLIVVPTRELCEQVARELRKFSKYKKAFIASIYGGVSLEPQFDALRHAEIIVGTPGRLLDHLQRGSLRLSGVRILVLDEADKMLDMGFIDDIKRIISQTPKERQTLLFSATISSEVHAIAQRYMRHPEKVAVRSYVPREKLIQYYYDVPQNDKFSLLVHLLKHEASGSVLVFCGTKRMVDVVAENLGRQGIQAQALHGDLSQDRRQKALGAFHEKKTRILVASDVASRGLDIQHVQYVINYDITKTAKEYIHRIGRTARAGREGKVISLLAPLDHENFRRVLRDSAINVEKLKRPQFPRVPFIMPQRGRRFGSGGGYGGQRRRRY